MRVLNSTILAAVFAGVLGTSLLAGQQRGVGPSIPTIRADVDLVLVNVTVTDSRNRFVAGLTKKHFKVFEDRVEQDILSVSNDDAPISLGIIYDRSGSMGGDFSRGQQTLLQDTRLAAYSCLKGDLRDDEYFLIEFSDTPHVSLDFTNDPGRLREKILFAAPKGRTALWDAIYAGVVKMEKGTHPRKALLVLTDGLENNSRYTLGQVKKMLLEQNVRIYSYTAHAAFDGLNGLSESTGGAVLKSNNACEELRGELRTQYVIGYRSTNRNKDGAFRKISVRLNPEAFPRALPSLTVRAKEGYYAPH